MPEQKEKEILPGKSEVTTSSDEYIASTLDSLRRATEATGTVVDVSDEDILGPILVSDNISQSAVSNSSENQEVSAENLDVAYSATGLRILAGRVRKKSR
ncbi:hypothetical protein A3D81_02670 [Candidatus Curtissbacteria bacterium RIFCSPHIGHO2_02_FULL_40_17]|uniref:Uncharacterized protein n=3 Tax=Candidatus Curtissiibacteriota TaxID=1752717 RepID=A0A1F5GJI3_9BACT|nr:MAG: hypothetical protein A3D81_02670 [Candidatus Curtissbacteria bacterium RIFCSPHIGHO2_02_FULL_40_17]OGE05230.1 MAG: hypothetical protein A3F45_02030 [Candidatus Curtissbacteria bacterium RIFCSPHIGHO2_12_FULL_41_17]OGE06403.1 MAG: hypothetical protein A3I53_01790 [Candidatus Curtissbacteria bacterium RIFCSPLOWO2_02_FULL_40_13b]